jgi:hypothetical protein
MLRLAVSTACAIRQSSRTPDARDFYKLFFLCERLDRRAPRAGGEIIDVGYFALESLPELSTARVVEADIRAAFAFHDGVTSLTAFD